MRQRRILNLAIIGLPPDWTSRYVPALDRLKGRVRIDSLYDPLAVRGEEAAKAHSARFAGGVRAALESRRADAVLLLHNGWQLGWTLRALGTRGLPCLVGQQVLRSLPDWSLFGAPAAPTDVQAEFIPECRLRYQPALLRLRELIATGLGWPLQMHLDFERAQRQLDADLSLREVLNWLWTSFEGGAGGLHLGDVQRSQEQITAALTAGPPAASRPQFQIELVARRVDDELPGRPSESALPQEEPFCRVVCQKGTAALSGPRRIEWEAGGELVQEQLAEDRSASAVALDLFARRAMGGLIPLPALADLARAQGLADTIQAAAR